MSSLFRLAGVAALGLTVGACATVTNGTTQAIKVDSEPAGADCVMLRGGAQIHSLVAPAQVTVKRDQQTIHVRCKKEGYEEALVVMNSRYETASSGNFLLGGVIGAMIDNSSGANAKYDPYVMVRLSALSSVDQAAAATRARIAPAAPSDVPAAPKPIASAAASSEVPAGPFDGLYSGGAALVSGPNSGGGLGGSGILRQIEVRVASGNAIGTVRYATCANAGEMKLTIDSAGYATGEANVLTGNTCGALPATVEGRAEPGRLLLTVRYENRTTEFSLARQ